jgi:hypothetical protein
MEDLLGQNGGPKCGGAARDNMGPRHAKGQCVDNGVDDLGNSRKRVNHVYIRNAVGLEDGLDSGGGTLAVKEVGCEDNNGDARC